MDHEVRTLDDAGTLHYGIMGRLTAGSGLQQLLEVVFAQNSVTHMLTGKATARAVRGHFFLQMLSLMLNSIERE